MHAPFPEPWNIFYIYAFFRLLPFRSAQFCVHQFCQESPSIRIEFLLGNPFKILSINQHDQSIQPGFQVLSNELVRGLMCSRKNRTTTLLVDRLSFSEPFFIKSGARDFSRSLRQPLQTALSWPPSLKSEASPTIERLGESGAGVRTGLQ